MTSLLSDANSYVLPWDDGIHTHEAYPGLFPSRTLDFNLPTNVDHRVDMVDASASRDPLFDNSDTFTTLEYNETSLLPYQKPYSSLTPNWTFCPSPFYSAGAVPAWDIVMPKRRATAPCRRRCMEGVELERPITFFAPRSLGKISECSSFSLVSEQVLTYSCNIVTHPLLGQGASHSVFGPDHTRYPPRCRPFLMTQTTNQEFDYDEGLRSSSPPSFVIRGNDNPRPSRYIRRATKEHLEPVTYHPTYH